MADPVADAATYSANVNGAAVAAIVKYCGIALQHADSAQVSISDPKELATVREVLAAKMPGLRAEATDAGIKTVAEKIKGTAHKSRVTFCYMLAEATGTLGRLG
jgi:hypothetical protein